MKKSKFTEEQIVGIRRQHEAGAATAHLCRKHRISSGTFYNWKAKYGGLDDRQNPYEVNDNLRLSW